MKNKNTIEQIRRSIIPLGIVSFLMTLVIQVSSLIPVYFMPRVIDEYIPNGDLRAILLSVLIFCGIPLFTSAFYNFYQFYLVKKARKFTMKVSRDCFEKLLYQPMRFFDETHSAEISRKCSQEANSYVLVRAMDIPKLSAAMLSTVFIFVLLWRIHPVLAVVQIVYFPLVLIIMKLVGVKLENYIASIMNYNAKLQKIMQEAFHAVRVIKTARLEDFCVNRVQGVQNNILRIWGKTTFLDNLVGGVCTIFIPGIFYGGTFVLSAIFVMDGKISLGLLTAALGYATKIHGAISELITTYNTLKKSKGECDAIMTYLNMDDERDDKADNKWSFRSEIRISDVSFKYEGTDRTIINGLSMVFPKGKWIAVSGESGVGKTTLLELLMRFYSPDSGSISIDGVPIEKINLQELRSGIAYVTQDPFLIDGTIGDNLRLICDDEKEVMRAAKLTGIIDNIELGLDKEVGESGMLLSGGEKQRVAVAQCILKHKPLIMLDEVTSQLDQKSQDDIARLFKSICRDENATIISVAHRKEFNRYADMEYRIEKA